MRLLCLVLAAALLAGCGGGSGGSSFKSAADVARAAGCGDAKTNSPADQELFLTDSVSCTVNGHELMIGWFKTADALKNYRKVADSFGGSGLAYGSDWVVECHDAQADCDHVVSALK